jgi:hypothetical protein
MLEVTVAYVAVASLGALCGVGELVARYRDEPARALRRPPALLYIGVNALAAGGALGAMMLFDWRVMEGLREPALTAVRVITAGTASMALFRSSFFTLRVGDQDVAVGPSCFLQAILSATDRAVDRARAVERAAAVGRLLTGIPFAEIKTALPALSLALMQNLPESEQRLLAEEIRELEAADLSDGARTHLLGLSLLNTLGEEGLAAALGEWSSFRAPAPEF